MIRVNIHEAKTQLSRYLDKVEKGATIVICRRNVPVAEIRPLPKKRTRPRRLGLALGTARMREDFDVLPEELLSAFEGSEGR